MLVGGRLVAKGLMELDTKFVEAQHWVVEFDVLFLGRIGGRLDCLLIEEAMLRSAWVPGSPWWR